MGWVIILLDVVIITHVFMFGSHVEEPSRTVSVKAVSKNKTALRRPEVQGKETVATSVPDATGTHGMAKQVASSSTMHYINLKKRDEAKQCLSELHHNIKAQFNEHFDLNIPILNSVQRMSNEISLFWALKRHTNMGDAEHSPFRDGIYFMT